jgi:hypothetical protein
VVLGEATSADSSRGTFLDLDLSFLIAGGWVTT